jgi:hypothetical protein
MGATRVLAITNGTFDGDNKTISGASSISLGGTVVKNVLTAVPTVTNSLTALTMGRRRLRAQQRAPRLFLWLMKIVV